ncbi:cyclophilin-like protein [Testicularia cyperi]|uniref:Peptidyl-prolyl cis-trans isomerase n=1 Tax=Testicularia cyperi TaxID=1882483 RepID=A0A317XIY0_9BASI|nr:cyclophilin-like protein [Testicularia cyperi]
MSVLLETSLGDIVIDLETEQCPRSSINFLKLCARHYYKFNAVFRVERDFLAQMGDPTDTGKGGASVWSLLPASSRDRTDEPFFRPDVTEGLRHARKGTVSFACSRRGDADGSRKSSEDDTADADGKDLIAGSQFFITLKDEIDYLDGRHAPFGTVVEGQEPGGTLDKINEAFVDEQKCPLKDIRIRHVVVLEDPFPDPDGFVVPSRSPSPTLEQARSLRLADDEDVTGQDEDDEQAEDRRRAADTNAAALTLEMVGDLPFAEIRPPENILFVCKLNPVTRSDDLELIFSRFGKILSCEVIRDKKTGDSLQYAFIEFDRKQDAEAAYFKMQNVLVDDRRIWVDFSQSVSRLHGDWVRKRNGGRDAPKGHYGWSNTGADRRDRGKDKGKGKGNDVDSYRPNRDRHGEDRSRRPPSPKEEGRKNGSSYRSQGDDGMEDGHGQRARKRSRFDVRDRHDDGGARNRADDRSSRHQELRRSSPSRSESRVDSRPGRYTSQDDDHRSRHTARDRDENRENRDSTRRDHEERRRADDAGSSRHPRRDSRDDSRHGRDRHGSERDRLDDRRKRDEDRDRSRHPDRDRDRDRDRGGERSDSRGTRDRDVDRDRRRGQRDRGDERRDSRR